MSGAIQPLPLYDFMAWRVSTLYSGSQLLVTLVTHYVVNYYFGAFYVSLVILLPLHVSESIHRKVNILDT